MTTKVMNRILVPILLIAGTAAPALAQDASAPAATAPAPARSTGEIIGRQIEKALAEAIAQEKDGNDTRGEHAESHAVEIVVPVAFFLFVLAVVAVPLYLGFRKERQRQETLRAIIDKGGAIPPELLAPAERREDASGKDRRRGIILIAAGLGIAGFFVVIGVWEGIGIALIPMFIGGGYLVVWGLDRRE
jgi:Flp pilus assembly protein TadB